MNARSLRKLRLGSAPFRTRRHMHALALVLLAGMAGSCQAQQKASETPATPPGSDPRAIQIADHVMEQLGGRAQWDSLRGIRWTFGSEIAGTVRGVPRRHAWDKTTGWHRVEGTTREGESFVIVHNLKDSTGSGWVNGTRIEGDSLRKLIAFGKSLWTNDSYWFLMPYKLRDPGVAVTYAGEDSMNGTICDKLALAFQNVGETPGDHYWVYVDQAAGRVVRWDYVLEGEEPPPKSWTWEGWELHDGLWFPTAHRQIGADPPDSARAVFTRDVQTVREFPASEFAAR